MHVMTPDEIAHLFKAELIQLGYAFFEDGDFDLNLIGLRNAANHSNLFDDTFVALFKDEGEWQYKSWAFTSDPGRKWLQRPMRPEGCAIVVPGQYRGVYTLGQHTGKPALVQSGMLRVWRDNDRDDVADYGGPVHEGSGYCINIHRAGADSKLIEDWSAGCQVFKRSADLDEFLALCDRQIARGWNRFSYTLINVKGTPLLAQFILAP
jgi:hypothetical protein